MILTEKIYLSDSGPKVSPAIYGFYRWDDIDHPSKKMEKIIALCLELGINSFDHADHYGGSRCEELFGKIISRKSIKREELVLFTKCGLVHPQKSLQKTGPKQYNTSGEYILQCVDNSLRKLKTDYIDVFLLEHFDPLANLDETVIILKQLHDSGKVKNFGVFNYTVFQHQLMASYLRVPIVTNPIEFNILHCSALENGQLDYIRQKYLRPLAWSPLAAGRIAHGRDAQAIRVRNRLKKIARKYDAEMESIAVAWLVKLGALPLIGTTHEKQIRNIVKAFQIDLDRQDWYDLYAASKGEIPDQ